MHRHVGSREFGRSPRGGMAGRPDVSSRRAGVPSTRARARRDRRSTRAIRHARAFGDRPHCCEDRRCTVSRRGCESCQSVSEPFPPPLRCGNGHADAHVRAVASSPARVVAVDARRDADKRGTRCGLRRLGPPVADCPRDVRPAAIGPADEGAAERTHARGRGNGPLSVRRNATTS